MRRLELLAPARDKDVAMHAIMHGADAVYMGGPSHGARAAASNSLADLQEVADKAHFYGARLYVTLNTLVYDSETPAVERLVADYWRIGADALIVQDMGLLRMDLPPIALHASTQCDIRTPEKALFLASCGMSQLVLPREFSLDEIRAVSRAVGPGVSLEAFVHGALCVSYSGDCQASCAACGRSANRGECAQMCRMAYDLVDGNGRVAVRDKHLLSLRDLSRLSTPGAIEEMALAGISSFKIEGRLKDAAYVKNAVAAYRRELDSVIAKHPGLFCRASAGEVTVAFEPDVERAFNRGFTSYFLHGADRQARMASIDSPKWIGQRVGETRRKAGNCIIADLSCELSNGDGLVYFGPGGKPVGFRANRVEGNKIYPASEVDIAPGTPLYRNRDTARDALVDRSNASRTLAADMALSMADGLVTLEIESESGIKARASMDAPSETARQSQAEARRRVLSKLGGTGLTLRRLDDRLPADLFVPASQLADLRRKAVGALAQAAERGYKRELRRPEDTDAKWPGGPLTYHDNVANRLAREFYENHGAEVGEPALELMPKSRLAGKTVMTTRYCLRRELGACLKDGGDARLKGPLRLTNKAVSYRLDFDCARCLMRVINDR